MSKNSYDKLEEEEIKMKGGRNDDKSTEVLRVLKDDLEGAINAVDRVKGGEKDKILQEKLKSHAKQLIIHVPNLRHYLMSQEEYKGEEDLKSGRFADLISRMQGEIADARQLNESLMRDLMNEKEHQRKSEAMKQQNMEETRSRLEQIKAQLTDSMQFNRESSEQHQLTQEGIQELDRRTSLMYETINQSIALAKEEMEAKQQKDIENIRVQYEGKIKMLETELANTQSINKAIIDVKKELSYEITVSSKQVLQQISQQQPARIIQRADESLGLAQSQMQSVPVIEKPYMKDVDCQFEIQEEEKKNEGPVPAPVLAYDADAHKRYLHKSVFGQFKDYYEWKDQNFIIFKFDYSFISEKCFNFQLINNECRQILSPQLKNPLNRVRLMLQPTEDVNGQAQEKMEIQFFAMDAVAQGHQPQNSLQDTNNGDTTEGEIQGGEGLKLWKSEPIQVKKDTLYRFGFELTIPKARFTCYFTPHGTRDAKTFSQGEIMDLQSIFIH